MNKIEFKNTNNIFINAGIVALHRYIKKYLVSNPEKYTVSANVLEKNKLIVQCDKLMNLLEDVYYFMGGEYYDTITYKQLQEKNKYYFIKEPFDAIAFAKIKTLGYASILTKNPPVTKGKGGEKIKFDKLFKEEKDFAIKIAKFLFDNNQKLKFYSFIGNELKENDLDINNKRKENRGGYSEIFINAGYTTIPQLDFNVKYILKGTKKCPLLNESFKYLVKNKSSSPFLAGLSNFNSHLESEDKAISWKALLLLRFSPALAFYHYKNGYDTLICNFFNSNNLQNIDQLTGPILYKPKIELQNQKPLTYTSNFNFFDFSYSKKDNETYTVKSSDDAVYSSELNFLMLYTFYKRLFENKIVEKTLTNNNNFFDPFAQHPLEKIPISIISFKADKFASTLRPNEFEEFNNVKYIFGLIYHLEHQEKVLIKDIWKGLKIKTEKTKILKFDKAKWEERKIRAQVFNNILKGKTIRYSIEKLFYDSFNNKINGFNTGYRRYDKILKFLLVYEQTLKSSNIEKELQKKAIKLGMSIGQRILCYDKVDKLTNAKEGRKYLIGLHKSRTLKQFLDGLYRIANKYKISISNDILENIDEDNFILIRQFAMIGTLNQLNSALYTKSEIT